MKLPKFTPGQVVLTDSVMCVIESAYAMYDSQLYVTNRGDVGEEDITHILNGKLWVPAERWNGPVEAVDRTKDVIEAMGYRKIEVRDEQREQES